MASEIQCKGMMLRNRAELLTELHGASRCEAILARTPRELRDGLVYGRIVSGGLYPLAWLRHLHGAAQEELGRGPELARELGYRGAQKTLRGVHKIFLAVSTPRGVLERSPRLLRAYFDGGEVEVVEADATRATVAFTHCAGFDRGVWESVVGTSQAALELSRAKNVDLRLELDPRAPGSARLHASFG